MNYRVILQAEGRSKDGKWFGLYAARDVRAVDGPEASRLATTQLQAAWNAAAHGQLDGADAVATWRAPVLSLRRSRTSGHTFYNDDAEAQREALRLEAEASGLPKRVLKDLLSRLP